LGQLSTLEVVKRPKLFVGQRLQEYEFPRRGHIYEDYLRGSCATGLTAMLSNSAGVHTHRAPTSSLSRRLILAAARQLKFMEQARVQKMNKRAAFVRP